MITQWTAHCKTPEEKEQFQESVKRAKWILDHLKVLIDGNLASNEAAEISPKAYDNTNWPYRQAHVNGYKQALRDLNKLLTIDQ